MKFILDSCVFLWMIDQHQNIPSSVKQEIANPLNEIYLSSISVSEITIKAQIGKLEIPKPFCEFIINQRKNNAISELPLKEKDLLILEKLPNIHSDPFDRSLICQAITNNMTLITPDTKIRQYPVNILWNTPNK